MLREYERGVVFRMGHVRPLHLPGLCVLIPLLDKMIRVDQRLVTLTIPPQEVITRDNVPARVNAVVMFQVMDPLKAILAVENYAVATSQIFPLPVDIITPFLRHPEKLRDIITAVDDDR